MNLRPVEYENAYFTFGNTPTHVHVSRCIYIAHKQYILYQYHVFQIVNSTIIVYRKCKTICFGKSIEKHEKYAIIPR